MDGLWLFSTHSIRLFQFFINHEVEYNPNIFDLSIVYRWSETTKKVRGPFPQLEATGDTPWLDAAERAGDLLLTFGKGRFMATMGEHIYWLVVWNFFHFSAYIWNNTPSWLIFFGVAQPPTSPYMGIFETHTLRDQPLMGIVFSATKPVLL